MELQIIAKLEYESKTGNSLTRKDLLAFVCCTFDSYLTFGWINAFIDRHFDKFHICRYLTQEDSRMVISRAFLEAHLINMKNHVEGRQVELVLNIDEVCSSD
jgi:hypothetical protein